MCEFSAAVGIYIVGTRCKLHMTYEPALRSLLLPQGRNVLKKEPMSKDINETDHFVYNSSFHSKFYKVKIGTVSAQKETEPEKQETRQKVCSPQLCTFTPSCPRDATRWALQSLVTVGNELHPLSSRHCPT